MCSRVVSEVPVKKHNKGTKRKKKKRCKIRNAIGIPIKAINNANVEIIIYCSKKSYT